MCTNDHELARDSYASLLKKCSVPTEIYYNLFDEVRVYTWQALAFCEALHVTLMSFSKKPPASAGWKHHGPPKVRQFCLEKLEEVRRQMADATPHQVLTYCTSAVSLIESGGNERIATLLPFTCDGDGTDDDLREMQALNIWAKLVQAAELEAPGMGEVLCAGLALMRDGSQTYVYLRQAIDRGFPKALALEQRLRVVGGKVYTEMFDED